MTAVQWVCTTQLTHLQFCGEGLHMHLLVVLFVLVKLHMRLEILLCEYTRKLLFCGGDCLFKDTQCYTCSRTILSAHNFNTEYLIGTFIIPFP